MSRVEILDRETGANDLCRDFAKAWPEYSMPNASSPIARAVARLRLGLANVLIRLGHPNVAVYNAGLMERCGRRTLPLKSVSELTSGAADLRHQEVIAWPCASSVQTRSVRPSAQPFPELLFRGPRSGMPDTDWCLRRRYFGHTRVPVSYRADVQIWPTAETAPVRSSGDGVIRCSPRGSTFGLDGESEQSASPVGHGFDCERRLLP